MKWFGVKTVILWKVHGKPKRKDANYDANVALLEEQVLLIKARDFDQAG